MIAVLCSLLLAAGGGRADPGQRGSAPLPSETSDQVARSIHATRGYTAGGEDRTATPLPGLESGQANGLEGGRTDTGPLGGTGVRFTGDEHGEQARANADDQARGRNAPGSFLRPADSPPQMNRNPKPMGSGAPELPVDEHL